MVGHHGYSINTAIAPRASHFSALKNTTEGLGGSPPNIETQLLVSTFVATRVYGSAQRIHSTITRTRSANL